MIFLQPWIYATPIRCRLPIISMSPPPHSMQEQLITVYVKRGGGEGVQSQIKKKKIKIFVLKKMYAKFIILKKTSSR